MSDRREELIRDGIAAFGRGDFEFLEMFHDDVEVYLPPEVPNSADFRGKQHYVPWLNNWLEAWEDFEIEITRIELVGEHHVVSDIHQTGRGKGSGIEVELDVFYLWEIRGEKLAAQHIYWDRDQAIEVARQRERERPD
jgi:ketosteroid isomerase-like protein